MQKMTESGRLLVVGAGGLGCSLLPLLAAEGLEIELWDDDLVSLSNLQRQLLFRDVDIGKAKAEVAAERVEALLPGAKIRPRLERLTPENALEAVAAASLVLDGSDNFPTRFLVNDACVLSQTALVHGGILRFLGQVMTVLPGVTPCYRCLFEAPPPEGSVPSCAEAGVLGALCGVVASSMAEAALELLQGRRPEGGLLVHDALLGKERWLPLERDAGCRVCGDCPEITSLEGLAPETAAG